MLTNQLHRHNQTIKCYSCAGHIVSHVFMIYLLLKKSKLFKKDKHKDEEELRYDPLLIKCPSVICKKGMYGNFYTVLVVNHNSSSVGFLFLPLIQIKYLI